MYTYIFDGVDLRRAHPSRSYAFESLESRLKSLLGPRARVMKETTRLNGDAMSPLHRGVSISHPPLSLSLLHTHSLSRSLSLCLLKGHLPRVIHHILATHLPRPPYVIVRIRRRYPLLPQLTEVPLLL